MRKSFTRFLSLLFVFCLVFVFTTVKAQNPAQETVKLYAGSTTACFNQSNVYSVNVSVKDFNKLSQFDLALSYPEAVFGYLNYEALPGWTGGAISVTSAGNGTVSITWTGSETTITDQTDIIRLDFSLDGMAPASVQALNWTKASFQYTLNSTGYAFTGSTTPGSIAVTQSYPDANILTAITSETCPGVSGGKAKLKITSPTGVYYSFNGLPYTASNEFDATPGSNVIVRVKSTNGSADGCVSYAKTVAVPVAVNPVAFTVSSTNPACPGAPGSVLISATGGSGAYTYYINSTASTVSATTSTNFQFNVPTNGTTTVTYQVAVQDANGCVDLANAANWKPVEVVDNNPIVTFDEEGSSQTDVLCNGSSTGSISVALTPAVKYFVSLNGGTWTATSSTGTKTFANLAAGTYTVTAKTVSDCTISDEAVFTITESDPLVISGLTVTDTSCGSTPFDGAIGVTITGGSGTYTVTIQEGANVTTQTGVSGSVVFNNLKPVYYSLTATDANGCSVSYVNPNNTENVIAVQSPADIQYTVTKTPIKCYGETSTLTITSVTGGTGSYTYTVNSGTPVTKSTPVFGGLVAGTYTVTVANASGTGCAISKVVTIAQPSAALHATAVVNFGPTCVDGSDGDIAITVTGGTPGFRYALNNGPLSLPSNSSVIHVAATVGNHTVRIVDANDCEYIIPGTVTVTQNSNVITAVSNGVINCYGKVEGKIIVGVTTWATGTATRVQTYKYSKVEADVFTAGSTLIPVGGTGTETTLAADTYYVGAIDQYGCKSNVKKVVITQNPMLEIVSVTPTGASCYNTFDGTITIVAKGGTASNTTNQPLQFAYVNNVLNPDVNSIEEARWQNMTYSSTTTFKTTFAVGKGEYYVFVRDVACAKLMWSEKITVTGYDQLKIDESKIVVGQPTCYESSNFTGSINVPVISGGNVNGTFKYTLYKSGVAVAGHIQQASGLFTGLASGTYTVKVEDSTGCPSYTTSNTYTINEISKVLITSVEKTNITCFGASDGKITINVDGGTYSSSVTTAQYSYAVNNQNLWVPFVGKSKTYIATVPGTFTIWVKDVNGCTSSPTTVQILEPATISATVTVTKNKVCNSGGEVVVTAAGGWTGGTATSTFEYKLDAAGTYTSTNVFTGLDAGTHSVTVRAKLLAPVTGYADNATCVKVLNFTITQPDAITYSVSLSNVKCWNTNTGSLTVTVLGGGTASSTDGYKVKLTGPSYDSGYLWTGATKVKAFNNLPTGIYTVYIQDKNGCELNASVGNTEAPYSTVESWNIQQPATALDVAATRISNAKCATSNDGVFAITATGGVAPYSFFTAKSELPAHIVLPDATNSSTWTLAEGSTYTMTTATEGTWIVWAKDANGCIVGGEDLAGVPVNRWRVQILAPDPITFAVGATNSATCNGKADGSIAITSIVGGTPTYTVTVSGLSTGNVEINKSVRTTGTASSVTVTGLPASLTYYTITVSDLNGCVAATATKTVKEPAAISVTLEAMEGSFTCPGSVEGWLEAKGSGGAGTYQYKLYQDGVQKVDWTEVTTFFVQIGHTFKVEVKNVGINAGTCTATAEVRIDEPVAITTTMQETTCFGDLNASVIIKAVGNPGRTFQYQYKANTAANYTAWATVTDQPITGFIFANEQVNQNFYYFNVKDNLGCTTSFTYSFVPTQNELQVTVAGVGGSASVTVTGGIAPYSYQVGTASKTTISGSVSGGSYAVAGLVDGTNTITIFDDHGCSKVVTYVADLMAPTATYSPNGTTTPTTDNHPALVITFSENVAVGTGNITIRKKSNGEAAIAAIPASAITVSGKTATVTYTGGLDKNAEYYVTIDNGVVKDLAGNAFAGVTASTTWTFKTGNSFLTGTDPKIDNSLEFKVYPNPFVDEVNIDNASELSKVVVSNIAGQVVKEVVNPERTIQLNQLVSGVYFISLYQENVVVKTVKIVKR